jgi:hypothetical protein
MEPYPVSYLQRVKVGFSEYARKPLLFSLFGLLLLCSCVGVVIVQRPWSSISLDDVIRWTMGWFQ